MSTLARLQPFRQFAFHHRLRFGNVAVVLCLLTIFGFLSPVTFLSPRIYASFMATIPFPAMLALAMTFLIIAKETDMSFPGILACSGFMFASVSSATGSPVLGLVASLTGGTIAGLINGLLVVKMGVPSIIITIGTQFFWYGLTTILAGGLSISLVSTRETALQQIMVGRLGDYLPMQAIWTLLLAGLFGLLYHRHPFGDDVRFIGDNPSAATMMGVRSDLIRILLFTIVGLVCGLVSVMICLEMSSWWPSLGEGYLLLVFASIFIGGTSVHGGRGTFFGTLCGALVIGMIEAGIIAAGLSGFWIRMIYGLIIVLSVTAYSHIFKQD